MTDHKRIVRFGELIVQDHGDETDLIIFYEGETAFLPFLLNRLQMGRNIGRIGGFDRGEQSIKLMPFIAAKGFRVRIQCFIVHKQGVPQLSQGLP
jgi:hypothetical protein